MWAGSVWRSARGRRVENSPVYAVLPERGKPVQWPAWQQNFRWWLSSHSEGLRQAESSKQDDVELGEESGPTIWVSVRGLSLILWPLESYQSFWNSFLLYKRRAVAWITLGSSLCLGHSVSEDWQTSDLMGNENGKNRSGTGRREVAMWTVV